MMKRTGKPKRGYSEVSVLFSCLFSIILFTFHIPLKGMRGEENPTDNGAELSLDLTKNNNLKKDIFIRLFSL